MGEGITGEECWTKTEIHQLANEWGEIAGLEEIDGWILRRRHGIAVELQTCEMACIQQSVRRWEKGGGWRIRWCRR